MAPGDDNCAVHVHGLAPRRASGKLRACRARHGGPVHKRFVTLSDVVKDWLPAYALAPSGHMLQ